MDAPLRSLMKNPRRHRFKMEKQNVPQLRFPEFKKEWEDKLLESIATRGSGHTPSKSHPEYYNGGIKWVSLADSKRLDQGYIYETEIEISKEGLENSSAVLHPAETVILSRDAGVGKSAVTFSEMAVSQHFIAWQGIEGKLSNWFLYSILQIHKREFERIAVGNTIKTIGLPYFKKMKVTIPLLPEQQKIASFLSAVDKKIEQLTRKKELLEEYKKGVMQKLFPKPGEQHPELRFKDENGEDFPDWEVKRLYKIASFFSGGTPATGNKEYYGGDIPFIKSGEIENSKTEQFINENALSNSSAKMVNEGDILMALYGANSGEIAISKINGAINQAILCIRTKQITNYIFYYLWVIKERVVSTYLQGGQGNLSASIVKKIQIPIPCVKEQELLVKFISELDNRNSTIEASIQKTQDFKKGLLQKMFV